MSSILKVDQLQDSGGNNIITSDGSGNVTSVGFNNAGGLVLLNSASSTTNIAQLDIDSTYINSTYDSYYLTLNMLPATDDVNARCQFFQNGTIINGGADYTYRNFVSGGSSYVGGKNESIDEIKLANNSNNGNATGETATFKIWFLNTNSTSIKTSIIFDTIFSNISSAFRTEKGFGGLNDHTKTINGFRVYWSSGDVSEYDYKLYGVK